MHQTPTPASPGRTSSAAVDRVADAFGVACVVAGGLVAAVTGPLALTQGSWLAAYLVLVCGVGLCVLSRQDALVRATSRERAHPWVRPTAWTVGNTLVVLGVLASRPLVTDAGGALLLGGLVLAASETRGAGRRGPAVVVRVVYGILATSVPIGLTLAHLRS